ncbi:MAG: MBL fold metallo-hydrolase [Myxococcota bacterium]
MAELTLADIRVRATSVAGLETCIELPDFKLAFDIGRGPKSAASMKTVLFTHAHIDHMGGIAHHVATRSMLGMTPPTYVVPSKLVGRVETLLDAFRALDDSELAVTIQGADPGDRIDIGKRRIVRPLTAFHPVACQGYAVMGLRNQLRADLQGKDSSAVREARGRGEEVTSEVEYPLVVFSGDTKIEFIEHNEVARKADLLIMEVTFVDDRVSVEAARSNGHVHLDEVIERADLFENKAILFTHLSARYRQSEALEILDRRLPESLKSRVTLLPRPHWCH